MKQLDEIRLANERVKKARRDAMTLGRLTRTYPIDATDLFNVIDDERKQASVDTIQAIFDAGRDYCIEHAGAVLDNLR